MELCSPWATPEDATGTEECPGPGAGIDADALAAGLLEASEWLFAKSGWRFPGTCTRSGATAARPCSTRPGGGIWWGDDLRTIEEVAPWAAVVGCGTCPCGPGLCSCCGPNGVALGAAPVISIQQVRLDGVVLDTAQYTLVGNVLVRLDPSNPDNEPTWPCCQRLDLPDSEPDTFAVDFTWGAIPPALGKRAAIDLGSIMAKAACGDDTCKPVQNLVRKQAQGVTVEVQSPVGELDRTMPRSVRMFLDPEAYGSKYGREPRMRRPVVTRPAGSWRR